MAKVRVYELARELDMESKELVDKLNAGGMIIKNYMGTLDEASIAKARKIVSGMVSQVVEEKRIKSTVIRRRKKVIKVEQPPPEMPEEEANIDSVEELEVEPPKEDMEPEESISPEEPVEELPQEKPSEETVSEEPPTEETVSEEPPTEETVSEEPPTEETLPEEQIPSESIEAEKTEEEIPSEKGQIEPELETPPHFEESEKEESTKDPIEEETLKQSKSPKEEPVAETEKKGQDLTDEKTPETVKKPKQKSKKGKKKKVAMPARIIKRPEEGPLKDLLARQEKEALARKIASAEAKKTPAKPAKRTPPAAGKRMPPPGMAKGLEKKAPLIINPDKPPSRKKGKRKPGADASPSDTGFKRRKKEVYERSDLYGGKSKKSRGKGKGRKKGREVVRKLKQTEITTPKALKRKIKVQEFVTIPELAKAMGTKATDLIKRLMELGTMVNITQSIDFDTASVVADVLGFELELDTFEEGDYFPETEDRQEDLVPRPPVVTIMGHVDHGKTSLLDYIRNSNIIGGESGGITQHIGAYYVKMEGGDIVFLDTPGHAAFTAMRARGAKITDLIVLVVAAEDGVMPQTKEAINHARAAGIPLVVAVNKIDKPDADPERVKRELAELDLAPEEWGGETLYGHISAKTGEGIEDLLGLISLQAEILELRGNPNKQASGTVVEAELDKSKGPVATILVKDGSLHKGDHFVCGEHHGKVRAMLDHRGRRIQIAEPSVPVALYGISGVPMAGDNFMVVKDEKTAKQIMEHRKEKGKKQDPGKQGVVSLDELFERIKEGEVKELNIVLKADVQGSAEALAESLTKQSTEAIKLNVIHSATGAIAESDVMLATASGAIIIGFNVRANPRVAALAEKEKVDIRYYDVIYNAINDIRLAMVGLLEPVLQERVTGHANIKEIFKVPKVGSVAGCQVTDGKIDRKSKIRLLRDDVVVFDGKIASLRRFKEDTKEVQSGYECGIGLENFNDIKPGDVFEVYEVDEIAAEL